MSEYIQAPEQDVVISSRVRLARNFMDIPFVNRQTDEQAEECVRRVSGITVDGINAFALYKMSELGDSQRMELAEHRLISNELMAARTRGAAVISTSRDISVLINEDDHIRIQALMPGLQLDRSAEMAFAIDDTIGAKYQMAFDPQLGYLTSYPTDVGTGMRISAVLHLPALTAARQIGPVMQTVSKLGLTLRGFYGEGSEVRGNMYVLTNQSSLGRSEVDMLNSVHAAAEQLVGHERQTREDAEKSDMLALQDRLMRSLGEVLEARILTAKEMTRRISDIRYAASMGYVHASISELDQLLMDMQAGSLMLLAEKQLNDRERDALRADVMRRRIVELQKAE